MESTTIEYYIKQDCNLTMVGSKLDSKDYGIAMPKSELQDNREQQKQKKQLCNSCYFLDSRYRIPVNNAILALQESGKLEYLKSIWWKKQNPSPDQTCPVIKTHDKI